MGKSDKKVRAESINKLRKQYDAFLEEDRKRKERNDDILSKLDKMRNAVRHQKGTTYVDPRSSLAVFGDMSTNFIRYNEPQVPMQIDIRNKYTDNETYMLSQISKKYILIPKSRTMIDNDYNLTTGIPRENNGDNDWKSKYSILDTLKQTEKEEVNNALVDDRNDNYYDLSSELSQLKCRKDDGQADNTVKSNNVKDIKTKQTSHFNPTLRTLEDKESTSKQNNKDDISEKQLLATNPKETIPFKSNEPSNANEELDLSNKNNDNSTRKNDFHAHQQMHLKTDNNLKISSSANESHVPVAESIEPTLYEEIAVHHRLDENYSKHETEGTEKTNCEPDISHVEIIHADKLPQEKSDDTANIVGATDNNYPIDIINVQDFTPHNDVALVDGVNINPEGHDGAGAYYGQSYQHPADANVYADQNKTISHQEHDHDHDTDDINPGLVPNEIYTDPTQQYGNLEEQVPDEAYNEPIQQYDTTTTDVENMENVLGIQAFEAEQNEMFYSEQPAESYEQYHQEGDAYNAGYSEPMEGYDPNAYYESAQQEAFPVEINEHEETSQRYDPVYEQQYVTADAEGASYAEQTQYAEQLQNEQEELVPTELEYDQSQYKAEQLGISEQVEQQLDHEAGYIQQMDDTVQGVDGSAPYQQNPDQVPIQNASNVAVSQKDI